MFFWELSSEKQVVILDESSKVKVGLENDVFYLYSLSKYPHSMMLCIRNFRVMVDV